MCSRQIEKDWIAKGFKCIVATDEVGCGCLAGPVTIAMCHVPLDVEIKGINDSKKISEKKRIAIYEELIKHPKVRYVVVHIDNQIIDEINILQARFRGFHQAYKDLKTIMPDIDLVLIDGNQTPPQFRDEPVKTETIVQGDGKCVCIAAASIIAKVTRDRLMESYDAQFPGYEFKKRKGYWSQSQVDTIKARGPTPIHRKTFRGVRQDN